MKCRDLLLCFLFKHGSLDLEDRKVEQIKVVLHCPNLGSILYCVCIHILHKYTHIITHISVLYLYITYTIIYMYYVIIYYIMYYYMYRIYINDCQCKTCTGGGSHAIMLSQTLRRRPNFQIEVPRGPRGPRSQLGPHFKRILNGPWHHFAQVYNDG